MAYVFDAFDGVCWCSVQAGADRYLLARGLDLNPDPMPAKGAVVLRSGALPPGLRLENGMIIGVPERPGDWYFTVQFLAIRCGDQTYYADDPDTPPSPNFKSPSPILQIEIKTVGSAMPQALP